MNKLNKKLAFIPLVIAIISLIILISVNFYQKSTINKTYVAFLNDVSNNRVSTVYATNDSKIRVVLKNGSNYTTDNPKTNNFKETLLKDGINVQEQSPASVGQTIATMLFVFSIASFAVILIRSSNITSAGVLSVDHLDASASVNSKCSFNDIAGNEEAKESVKDLVDFLQNPEKYSAYGARMPKGVILYGEPGTGKTLLAKAVAGEANVPFFAMSGSDFIQVYVGVGASRIRQLFKKAKACGKAVIFIDEIDAIGKARNNSKSGGSDEKDQTLNALLTEMSGFNEKEGIIVMAATNRLDMLDPALLRPGRFDRHVEITLPDVSARVKIISLHLKNKPKGDINLNEWAQKTAYFSGAKLESLVNEAAILACKDNSKQIEEKHMDKAYSIVLAGHEKVDRDYIKENDKKITAFHEIGHALTSLLILPFEKISKVTIIPSTKGAGGYTLSIPEDNMYQNKDYLLKRIMVLLGGRAAEEIILGKDFITTGAFNDLKNATSIITNIVTKYGMGDSLGLLNFDELSNLNGIGTEKIVEECKSVLNKLYDNVVELLKNNINLLNTISNVLIEKETIYYEDLILLMKTSEKVDHIN